MGHSPGREQRWWAFLAIVGVTGATAASFTHAFTTGADVATALPVAAGALALVVRMAGRRGATASVPAGPEEHRPTARDQMVWATLAGAAAAWEIASYVGMPRTAHPTLSSLIDILDSTRPGKAAAFAAWLALGWWLIER
ncbi:MAG: hypothetical protein ACRDY1_01480 [Acidimicrobiales bacterium]